MSTQFWGKLSLILSCCLYLWKTVLQLYFIWFVFSLLSVALQQSIISWYVKKLCSETSSDMTNLPKSILYKITTRNCFICYTIYLMKVQNCSQGCVMKVQNCSQGCVILYFVDTTCSVHNFLRRMKPLSSFLMKFKKLFSFLHLIKDAHSMESNFSF